MLGRSFWLALQTDGLGPTLARARLHLYGETEYHVFVRYLTPPSITPVLPAETNGVLIRPLEARDLGDPHVRRRQPREAGFPGTDAFVAVRQGRIVGAAWYTSTVFPTEPWYPAVAPHLLPPARFTANLFARPGERGVSWALLTTANGVLGAAGVRTIVSIVGRNNKPSVLLARLLGGRIVGRLRVQHRFGRRLDCLQIISDDHVAFGSMVRSADTRHG